MDKPEVADSPVKVNFNIDVNKLLGHVLSRSTRNDLMVVVKNGTTRDATVSFSIEPGGHGNLARVEGSPNISPVDVKAAAVTAAYCAIGIHAVGAGSNVYLSIPFAGKVLHAICATPVYKENYVKYIVTDEDHSVKSMRSRLDKMDKHYANHGTVKASVGNGTAWFTITAESPAVCQIELRENTARIMYV